MARPMAAWKRGSAVSGQQRAGSVPQGTPAAGGALPPAAASALRVPRECPSTPARAVSTRGPNQPPSALSTLERSLTRSAMLKGTSCREHGPARPSLQGMRL